MRQTQAVTPKRHELMQPLVAAHMIVGLLQGQAASPWHTIQLQQLEAALGELARQIGRLP